MAEFPYPLTPDAERDLWRFFGVETDDPFCLDLPPETVVGAALTDTPFARAFVAWREERGSVMEHSCFTCKHNYDGGYGKYKCRNANVVRRSHYWFDSGCTDSPDGMPTDRTIDCPGWEKRKEG